MEWSELDDFAREWLEPDEESLSDDALPLVKQNRQFRDILGDVNRCRQFVTSKWSGPASDAFNADTRRKINRCLNFARAMDAYIMELNDMPPDKPIRRRAVKRKKSAPYRHGIYVKVCTRNLLKGAQIMQNSADAMQGVMNRMGEVLSRHIPNHPFPMPGSEKPEADFHSLRRKLFLLPSQFQESAQDLRAISRVYESAEESIKQSNVKLELIDF